MAVLLGRSEARPGFPSTLTDASAACTIDSGFKFRTVAEYTVFVKATKS